MNPSGNKPNLKSKTPSTDKLRLQVFLSRSGVCSRRQAMDLIFQGKVKVNGKIAEEPSTPIDLKRDRVELNNKLVVWDTYKYILMHKPAGYVTTTATFYSEKNVLELLPEEFRSLNPVGRLDKDTEGLLLFTNDGDLAYRLTHPKFNVDKTYFVKIKGELTPEQKKRLEKGVMIEGGKTAPARVQDIKIISERSDFTMTIHEGRKRQIRLMLEAVGHKVTALKRITQGPLSLGTLKRGEWRQLEASETEGLKRLK